MRVGRKFSRPTSHIVLSKNVCLFSFFSSGVKKFRRFAVSAVSSVKKRAWRVGMERIENRTFDELEPGDTSAFPSFCEIKESNGRVAKKLKLQERRAVIPSRRSLVACRPLHFFGAINGALCGSAGTQGGLMEWARILAYITGTVDHELLLRNEYLAAENRMLKAQLKGRLRLSDAERAKLGEIGRRLGRKALGEVATAALPDTILAWYRRLVARKFDGSQKRRTPGRPRINREVEELIVRMAEE